MVLKEKAAQGVHNTVLEIFKVMERGTVLDCGAGSGILSKRIASLGFEVTATDINKEEFGAKNIPFVRWDLNKEIPSILNYKKFDYVVCIEVIEHIENPWKLIRDIRQLLNKGGILVLSTPNILNWYSRILYLTLGRFDRFFPSDKRISGHINPIPFWELEDILYSNGFKIINVTTNKINFFRGKGKGLIKILTSLFSFLTFPLSYLITTFGIKKYQKVVSQGEILIIVAKRIK